MNNFIRLKLNWLVYKGGCLFLDAYDGFDFKNIVKLNLALSRVD